jgi:putative Holliday junction resolvase
MAIPFRASAIAATPETTGVVLAIDYGKKRLGLALSDEHRVIARPFATWTRINRRRDLSRLRELVKQQAVRHIVVGLPLHLDGSASDISEEAKSFGARVAKALGIPVEMMDERLSSWEARQTISDMESQPRARRKSSGAGNRKVPLDDVAAAIILRDYLDRTHRPTESANDTRNDESNGERLKETASTHTKFADSKLRDRGFRE